VLWSPVEKTALAEAEVEYHDHKSTTIHVRFPVAKPSDPRLAGAAVAIWTTTPGHPGNPPRWRSRRRALRRREVADPREKSLAVAGEKPESSPDALARAARHGGRLRREAYHRAVPRRG